MSDFWWQVSEQEQKEYEAWLDTLETREFDKPAPEDFEWAKAEIQAINEGK